MASGDVESLEDLLGRGGGHAESQAVGEGLGHVSCIRETLGACKLPGKPVACNYVPLFNCVVYLIWDIIEPWPIILSYLAFQVSLKLLKRARSWKSLARHPSPRVQSSASSLVFNRE